MQILFFCTEFDFRTATNDRETFKKLEVGNTFVDLFEAMFMVIMKSLHTYNRNLKIDCNYYPCRICQRSYLMGLRTWYLFEIFYRDFHTLFQLDTFVFLVHNLLSADQSTGVCLFCITSRTSNGHKQSAWTM